MKVKPMVAELIATFCFVFTGVASIAGASLPGSTIGALGIVLAHALAIGVLASATMHISGGQLNPAVTIAVWLGNEITLLQAVANIFAQIVGSLGAVVALRELVGIEKMSAIEWGMPMLGNGATPMAGFAMEAIFAFILVLVVFGTAVDKRAFRIGGLYIGFAIAIAGLAIGPFTGASLNPARYFGPAMINANWTEWTTYILGPILGGSIAALIYVYGIGREDAIDLPGEGAHP